MGQEHCTTIEHRGVRQAGRGLALNGVFERIGPGYETSPAILAAMGVMRRDLAHAKEALEDLRDALASDGGDASGDELKAVERGLAGTSWALEKEISDHRAYLVSGEPERLAAEAE